MRKYNELVRKIDSYVRINDKEPMRIIIGRYTYLEIRREIEWCRVFQCNPLMRDTLCGLPIYTIDDDFYLEVAP